jgi:beta-glucuronidase
MSLCVCTFYRNCSNIPICMNHFIKILLLQILFSNICIAQTFKTAEIKDIALFPQQNSTRNAVNLSGIWQFKLDSQDVGESRNWFNGLTETRSIAVPGSWNEQFEDIRDYMGAVWYESKAFVPKSWNGQNIFIRVGSANYAAKVWINGVPAGAHEGGHLPFALNINSLVKFNAENTIVIKVENLLKASRVPTGGDGVPSLIGGFLSNFPKANFDFFPYGGLQRAVWLHTSPMDGIQDITVSTNIQNKDGEVVVTVQKKGNLSKGIATLTGAGKTYKGNVSFSGDKGTVSIKVADARFWSPSDPFLYDLNVSVGDDKDQYHLNVGIRTITVSDKQLILNGKPIQLTGFGKHEDFPIFGRGAAQPVMVKDFALLKWVGANSFRTSHYPYDEEQMNMADREGILIIDEIPAVGLFFEGDGLAARQEQCKRYIEELVTRDKNHPSVIMWSLANEPMSPKLDISSGRPGAPTEVSMQSFKELFALVKKLDNRPATIVGVMGGPVEWLALSDVICINRYWGWYTHTGDIKTGAAFLSKELDGLYEKLKKPIIITEFGADAQAGMHATPSEMFTEEYQTEFIKAYLDVAATKDFVTGMHVWAFADFKTSQGIIRFGGMNYKGVFTRDRKPKMAAHYLRSQWLKK